MENCILDLTLFVSLELIITDMERKDFIQKFAIGGSILLTPPILFSACNKDDDMEDPGEIRIELNDASNSALQTVGGFIYTGNIIVIRTGTNTYMALSKICTHEGFTVTYNHTSNNIICNNHGSVFTTSGAVVNGPAATNLRTYSVTIAGDTLIINTGT
jgi:cytochrome b6-f complex iron-sulfur subunit